jgi:hypothetical protein
LVHSRRARPTLRLLAEDLISGWESPTPARALTGGAYDDLHPLSELPHPIILKATECFGSDRADDNFVGPIRASTQLRLLEIKSGQWRGGVWEDTETGVHWLVVAGLAKGDHQDHDDFYQRIQRENGTLDRWLPTEQDERLLKRETASRLITEWELGVQEKMLSALREVQTGGSIRFEIPHPHPDKGMLATITLEVAPVREQTFEADEIVLDITPAPGYVGTDLAWQLKTRLLITLSPPEQDWDSYRTTHSNIAEPGAWSTRVTDLEALVANRELAESEPGSHSHYTHRKSLAGSTIQGHAVQALRGTYFVPTQDHQKLPVCPDCEQRYRALPKR